MLKSKKSKVIATGVAAALAVGAAGIGAVTTLNTTLTGNHFEATTNDGTPPADGSGLLVIDGAPITKVFSGTTNNESVEGTWTLHNKGDQATKWDGAMQNLKVADPTLAHALTLEFGEVNGSDTKWFDAGTLDAPKSYDQALGYASDTNTIDGGKNLDIPVRVTLKDPTALKGDPTNAKLELNTNFVVNYVNPDTAPGGGDSE